MTRHAAPRNPGIVPVRGSLTASGGTPYHPSSRLTNPRLAGPPPWAGPPDPPFDTGSELLQTRQSALRAVKAGRCTLTTEEW